MKGSSKALAGVLSLLFVCFLTGCGQIGDTPYDKTDGESAVDSLIPESSSATIAVDPPAFGQEGTTSTTVEKTGGTTTTLRLSAEQDEVDVDAMLTTSKQTEDTKTLTVNDKTTVKTDGATVGTTNSSTVGTTNSSTVGTTDSTTVGTTDSTSATATTRNNNFADNSGWSDFV